MSAKVVGGSGQPPSLGDRLEALEGVGRGTTHLPHRDAVGDVAPNPARRLIRQPERHLRLAIPRVAQPDPATQVIPVMPTQARSRRSSNSTTSISPPTGTEPIFQCTK